MTNDDQCVKHQIKLETLTENFIEQKEILETVIAELSRLSSLQVGNEAKVMQMLASMQEHCHKVGKILEGNGEPGLVKDCVILKEQSRTTKDKLDALTTNLKWVAALLVTTIVGILVEHFFKR